VTERNRLNGEIKKVWSQLFPSDYKRRTVQLIGRLWKLCPAIFYLKCEMDLKTAKTINKKSKTTKRKAMTWFDFMKAIMK
jgi:hypothetical protein